MESTKRPYSTLTDAYEACLLAEQRLKEAQEALSAPCDAPAVHKLKCAITSAVVESNKTLRMCETALKDTPLFVCEACNQPFADMSQKMTSDRDGRDYHPGNLVRCVACVARNSRCSCGRDLAWYGGGPHVMLKLRIGDYRSMVPKRCDVDVAVTTVAELKELALKHSNGRFQSVTLRYESKALVGAKNTLATQGVVNGSVIYVEGK